MARTLKEIKTSITTSFMANEILALEYGFVAGSDFDAEFSKVSLENFIFNLVAAAIFLLEQIFDTHKSEIKEIIRTEKPHTANWYRTKAKDFIYGLDLVENTDTYDTTGYDESEIEEKKIIKYSAVTKNAGQLLIKIATEADGVLKPISTLEMQSFEYYMSEIADCGVRYLVVNHKPDILLLNMKIFIDPLVLTSEGVNIRTGNKPVEDAIKQYMKELPFNGELVLAHLVDKLQKIEGVKIPHLVHAESQTIDIGTNSYREARPIEVKTVPLSGYFTIPNFDTISYVV